MFKFRNKIFLILIFTLSLCNIVFAETKSSSMTIEIIDETSAKPNVKTDNKQKTTNVNKNSTQKQQPTKSTHIPYTGWMQIPNTTNWVYFFQDMPLTGWQYIQGEWTGWFYFGEDFILYQNRYTPDGYFVDATGKWVENYKQSNSNSNTIVPKTITNIDNSIVKDPTSKYLYKRADYVVNSKSITSSTKLGEETIKNNIIRFTNNGSIIIPNTERYTTLTFSYIVEEPNDDNEYDLQILVNGELEDELDNFTGSKQTYTIEFDENSSVQFKWLVNTEDGSKSAKAVNLYIYDGILTKN